MSREEVAFAAEELSAALEVAAELLRQRFSQGGAVSLPDGSQLCLAKKGLMLVRAAGAEEPLLSTALASRTLAAAAVPQLWAACELNEHQRIGELRTAAEQLRAFLLTKTEEQP